MLPATWIEFAAIFTFTECEMSIQMKGWLGGSMKSPIDERIHGWCR